MDVSIKGMAGLVYEAVHKSLEQGTIEFALREMWTYMSTFRPRAFLTWPYEDVSTSFPKTFGNIFHRVIADEAKAERVFKEFFRLVKDAPVREGIHRLYVHRDELRMVTVQ